MKPTVVFDCEVYNNYFLVAFRNVDTGNVRHFEMRAGATLPEQSTLERILLSCTLISFNGNHYDIPILSAALGGATCQQLKDISDDIIQKNMKPWIVAKARKFTLLENLDHIDLIEVAPGIASLKIYGGRLHTKRMQDLPYEHTSALTPEQMTNVRNYCINDLQVTFDLWMELRPQIELRTKMSEEFCLELRSKSDAQIAEAVIKDGVGELLQRNIKAPVIAAGTPLQYRLPPFIDFSTPHLRDLAQEIASTEFIVGDGGSVDLPPTLKKRDVVIGNGVYRLGIGGLHSTEHSVAHYSDDEFQLIDRDVAAYYPSIILNQRLFPKQMGDAFLKIYRGIVERRLEAKRTGDKVTDAALKIVINGSFGKFGSKYSALYSPELLIQTTITGQLSLLMLIGWMEGSGIQVVSANTDGLVMKVPRNNMTEYEALVEGWELQTNFKTEATEYDSLLSRDVNNYVAIKSGRKGYKVKGVYAPAMLMKNPVNQICVDAVLASVLHGHDIRETITTCRDIRKFVTIRQVKGGATHCGTYLGKAVRWYYSTQCRGLTINYQVNGYTVARSEGAQPLMDLPDEFPGDVDFDWYVNEACSMLVDMGVV